MKFQVDTSEVDVKLCSDLKFSAYTEFVVASRRISENFLLSLSRVNYSL